MEYFVPQIELENALELKKELDEIELDKNEEFVFDFSKMHSFEPAAMLMTSSIIRRFCEQHPEANFSVENKEHCGYGGTMGFFEYSFPGQELSNKTGRGGKNYIPITKIVVDELRQEAIEKNEDLSNGSLMENEAKKMAAVLVQNQGNENLEDLFGFLIREIMRNVPEHADTDELWICGQYWPSKDIAEISVLDEGIGIYNSLIGNPDHKHYLKKNADALQWALKAGISKSIAPRVEQRSMDYWANSGYGLYMISQFCKRLDGVFCMASYGNYIKIEFDKDEPEIGETSFDGTAIQIRIKPSKLIDFESLREEICTEGEAEAIDVRGAFTKASEPSRGTMDKLGIKHD